MYMYYNRLSNGTFQKMVALRVYPWSKSTNKQVATTLKNYKSPQVGYETQKPRTILYRKTSRQ